MVVAAYLYVGQRPIKWKVPLRAAAQLCLADVLDEIILLQRVLEALRPKIIEDFGVTYTLAKARSGLWPPRWSGCRARSWWPVPQGQRAFN